MSLSYWRLNYFCDQNLNTGKVLCIDGWTSPNVILFISLTVHWIVEGHVQSLILDFVKFYYLFYWLLSSSNLLVVRNRFSNPTKVQEGRDWPRIDVMNRHQVKALREGCCERKEARIGVSSREKINTNKNLARVTTKSKSETQTVSNGRVGRGGRDGVLRSIPTSETSLSEQDRSQVVLRTRFNGDKTYDNWTGIYNSAEELLIETRTTGSLRHICYWNGDRRVSVIGVAVCMEEEETGMQTGDRGTYNWSPNRKWEQAPIQSLRSNQRSIAYNKIEIDWKERGLEPSGPRMAARWPADEAVWMTCGCAIVTWCPRDLGGHSMSGAGKAMGWIATGVGPKG